MKIGLIDVDGHNFPNLALMKLSAHHKTGGDAVEWCNRMETYDIVYMSKVFDETYTPDIEWNPISGTVMKGGTGYVRRVKEKGVSYIEFYRSGEWERYNPAVYDHTGTEYTVRGTGEVYTEELPWHIEHIYPDYSLYPELTKDTAYGYLTRGCPGRCPFCLVSRKEGDASIKSSDLWNFWDGQKYIKLMDPNILACADHINLLGQLADSKAYVDFTQGLDIRRVNEDNIDLINAIKVKEIHFAWDNPKEDLTERFRWYAEHAKHRPNGAYGRNARILRIIRKRSRMKDRLGYVHRTERAGSADGGGACGGEGESGGGNLSGADAGYAAEAWDIPGAAIRNHMYCKNRHQHV